MGIITKIATKNARSWLKNHWQYIIIFVAAIICTWAYLRPIGETIISVDAKFHIHRYFSFEVGLFNGGLNSFAESGIGSEPTIFYGPFQAAIVTVLHFLLSDMALAINIFIFLAVFFAGVLMYKFIKKYSKNDLIGLFSSIFYIATPYLYYESIQMQDHPTVLAFTLLPLIFWGFYKILNNEKYGPLMLGVSFALLLMTHILSTFQIGLVLILLIIINFKKTGNYKFLKNILYSGLIALGLSAVFWLPFIEVYSTGIYAVFNPDFPMIPWRTADGMNSYALNFLNPINNSAMTVIYGGFIVIALVLFIFGLKKKMQNDNKFKTILINSIVIFIISTILVSSLINWKYMPSLFYNLQFPFRFLLTGGFFLAILLGYLLYKMWDRKGIVWKILCGLCLFGCLIVYPIISTFGDPIKWQKINYAQSISSDGVKEYLPEKSANIPSEIVCDNMCSNYARIGSSARFDVASSQDTKIHLPLNYFPGYRARLDGAELTVSHDENGAVMIEVPANTTGTVYVEFHNTPSKIVGLTLTMVTIIVILVIVTRQKKSIFQTKKVQKKLD